MNCNAKHIVETIAKVIFFICAAVAIVAVLCITGYMFTKGTPALAKVGVIDLLFGTAWQPTAQTPSYGIFYIILTSIVGTAVAILIGGGGGEERIVELLELADVLCRHHCRREDGGEREKNLFH